MAALVLLVTVPAERGPLPLAPTLLRETFGGKADEPGPTVLSSQGNAITEVGSPATAVGTRWGRFVGIDPAHHLKLVIVRQTVDHPALRAGISQGWSEGPL